jgi:plastocyanin
MVLAIIALPVYAAGSSMANNTSSTNASMNKTVVNLTAKNIAFNTSTITVPASANVTVNFDNQDSGIPHNFAVYETSAAQSVIFKGEIITGPAKTTYTFTAPDAPGTYFFRCDVHPTQMTGQFVVS